MTHKPVLSKEVLKYLAPRPNENFIDATIGEGGHALAILEKNKPKGRVLGIDQDPEILKKIKFHQRLVLVNDSYANLKKLVEKYKFGPVNGILFDLGMSSWHLEKSGRGFSFLRDEPLDMRYSPQANPLTAEIILNQWPEDKISRVLKEYGEERFAKRIAKAVIKERPVKTTSQLVEIIRRAVPGKYRKGRIHFATRVFQALRITVNDELNNLKKVLPQAIEVLAFQGRIVIISFHSLEDRIVKNFFRDLSPEKLNILTKKPITSTQEEIKINPRSRSAKLRAAIKNE